MARQLRISRTVELTVAGLLLEFDITCAQDRALKCCKRLGLGQLLRAQVTERGYVSAATVMRV